MTNFENFKLESAEFIFGGELHATCVDNRDDLYDDCTGRTIFFCE